MNLYYQLASPRILEIFFAYTYYKWLLLHFVMTQWSILVSMYVGVMELFLPS